MAEDSLHTPKYSLPYPATSSDVKPASEDFKNLALSVEVNLIDAESRSVLRSTSLQTAVDVNLARMGDSVTAAQAAVAEGIETISGQVDDRLADVSTAYDVWLAEGNTGTRAEYLASLRGEKGDEGPYGGTEVTDPQVAALVSTGASETASAVREAVVPDMIGMLKTPIQIAHRGGCHAYPEHSMEAYEAACASGFTPEADVQALADGTLVCIHDATTGRTMTGPDVAVSSMTVEGWRSRRVLPASHNGVTSTGYGTPVTFDEYLDRFGGRVVLFPEAKGSANVAPMMAAIKARMLERSVVVASNALAGVDAVRAHGGVSMLTSNTYDPVAAYGRGVRFMAVSTSATQGYIDACQAAGLRVVQWTINRYVDAVTAWGKGVDGIYSDDPWEVFRPVVAARHDGWDRDYPGPGVASVGGAGASAIIDGGAVTITAGSARTYVKLGQFGYGPDRLRLRFWVQGISATTPAAWLFGVYLGSTDNYGPVTEVTAHNPALRLALCNTAGLKRVYRRAANESGVLNGEQASTSGDYFPTDGVGRSEAMQFEIEFTATQVIVRNLTRNDAPLIATSASISETGQYLTLAAFYSTVRFWDVQVTRG